METDCFPDLASKVSELNNNKQFKLSCVQGPRLQLDAECRLRILHIIDDYPNKSDFMKSVQNLVLNYGKLETIVRDENSSVRDTNLNTPDNRMSVSPGRKSYRVSTNSLTQNQHISNKKVKSIKEYE